MRLLSRLRLRNSLTLKPRFSLKAPLIIDISASKLIRIIATSYAQKKNSEPTPHSIELEGTEHVADILHSVRAAWDLILQGHNFPKKSEIILSGINITHMKEIVEAHGFVPVFADVEPETLLPSFQEIASKKTERTVGVLCAHLFGTWSPMDDLGNWCQNESIFLVEDCAQAFMGRDFFGTSNATASLFSFGTIKRATALGGATAIIRNKQLRNRILEIQKTYPEQNKKKLREKAQKILTLKAACQKNAYAAVVGALQMRFGTHEEVLRSAVRGFPCGTVPNMFRIRPNNTQRQLVLDSWKSSTKDVWYKRSKQMLEAAQKSGISHTVFLGHNAHVHTFWLLPVISSNPEALMRNARRKGWDATRGVTSMAAIGNDPNSMAAKILKKIVYLPVSQHEIPNFKNIKIQ